MIPKFYENIDNNHCLQCCVRMVLDSVLPRETSESVVDRETEYDPNLWTWTISGARFLSQELKNVQIITDVFDYRQFVQNGKVYLKQVWNEERLKQQESHASYGFKKEIELASKFLESGGEVKHYNFTRDSVEELLRQNFLITQVDHGKLYNQNSSSHCILIYSKQRDEFEVHDPGQPPMRSHSIGWDRFEAAFLAN